MPPYVTDGKIKHKLHTALSTNVARNMSGE